MTLLTGEEIAASTVHLTGQPRKRQVTECGQPIDGQAHQQTMLIGSVDCEECKTIWRASKQRGGFSSRPRRF